MRGEITYLFVVVAFSACWHPYHFSLFLIVSLLFKCCFAAWRREFHWKYASCCLCHNKWVFFWIFDVFGSDFRMLAVILVSDFWCLTRLPPSKRCHNAQSDFYYTLPPTYTHTHTHLPAFFFFFFFNCKSDFPMFSHYDRVQHWGKSGNQSVIFYVCSHQGDIRQKTKQKQQQQHIIIIYTNFPTRLWTIDLTMLVIISVLYKISLTLL